MSPVTEVTSRHLCHVLLWEAVTRSHADPRGRGHTRARVPGAGVTGPVTSRFLKAEQRCRQAAAAGVGVRGGEAAWVTLGDAGAASSDRGGQARGPSP